MFINAVKLYWVATISTYFNMSCVTFWSLCITSMSVLRIFIHTRFLCKIISCSVLWLRLYFKHSYIWIMLFVLIVDVYNLCTVISCLSSSHHWAPVICDLCGLFTECVEYNFNHNYKTLNMIRLKADNTHD